MSFYLMKSNKLIVSMRLRTLLFASVALVTFSEFSLSSEVDQPLLAEDKIIEKSIQPEFPINLDSDTTTMDGISREIENCGNARISQGDINLQANCIVAKKGAKGEYEYFEARGVPATLEVFDRIKKEYLFLSAHRIFYDVMKQSFTATDTAILVLSSDKNSELSPDRLKIQSNEINVTSDEKKQRMIEARGIPVNLVIHSEGNIELNAKSLYLSYSTETNELNLLKKVEAELALGKITAGEFRYNHRTKQSSFKKAPGQQIRIVQNKQTEKDKNKDKKSEPK